MESKEAMVCPLCRSDKAKIFAVGECAHPVCHLCSTKMRILCEQTYCAICRQELPRVYFVADLADAQPAIDPSRFTPIDDTGDCGIYYPMKAEWVRRDTEKLLRNYCPFCPVEYETFEILRDHVRRAHRYFYCDLCVEHLDLFPFERKCYTRHDLVQHTRQGDRDDTSFKGHPLCRFCDDHFLDVDQLYKHMRKEHYFCHLCTTDNVYYSDFDLLRDHYRTSHYLCEIDQCKDVQFTNVFASETDFRAHQAAQHSKNRAHARQLGTIAVEFQSTSARDRKQPRESAHRGVFRSGEFNTQTNNNTARNEREDIQPDPAVATSVPSIAEFPTLSERSSSAQNVSQRGAWSSDGGRGIHSTADFPALAGAAANVPTGSAGQPRGIWREQQQQQAISTSSSVSQSTTAKKAPQPSKPVTNGVAAGRASEDFPALRPAANNRIPGPVSMFSAWTTAKKSTKSTSASARANQPQMRMNTNRILHDEEDEEYIRRPMTSLTTSTAPSASSNITVISSSDLSGVHANEKQNQAKNQSLPKAQDFPALPTSKTTQNNVPSGAWTAGGTNSRPDSPLAQQKKKTSGTSKKKFMEELHSMPPPPSLTSSNDFPAIGLNELGRRLITDENEPALTTVVKNEKPPSPPVPPPPSATKKEKKEKKEENTTAAAPSTKKTQKPNKTNEAVKQETPSPKNEPPAKSVNNQASLPPSTQTEAAAPLPVPSVQPPPGFTSLASVAPPPGFNALATPQPAPSSYIVASSHAKQKNDFRAKLFELFDGDMTLFNEYDQFCEAYAEKKISTKDFISYTKQLFKDKLDEYLLELLVLIPNIDQQNELYHLWKTEIHPSSSTTAPTGSNWTKKKHDESNIYNCRICRQIMFDTDTDEHNSHHTEFNSQFPSLPAAALPLGRAAGGKKKK